MDENKNTRKPAGGTKRPLDPHNKPIKADKRPNRRGRFKNTRGQNAKLKEMAVKDDTLKIEGLDSNRQSGGAQKRFSKPQKHNLRRPGKSSGTGERAGEEGAQKSHNQRQNRTDKRQSLPPDSVQDKDQALNTNSHKPADNRSGFKKGDRSRRNTKNRSGKNSETPAPLEPLNVIDDDVSIFLPEFLISSYSPKSIPAPEAEPQYVPGAYNFPDDTAQIVFGDEPKEISSEAGSEEPADSVELVEVVDVRFKMSGKTYFFSPNGFTLSKNEDVIVETARGIEFGTVVQPNRNVPLHDVVPPLKNVLRLATEEDRERRAANEAKEIDAFNICLEKIEIYRLDMKLVDVEYTFDNSKLLFYFSAEGRVDFRELARDLASVFRTRIELRQIGIRDEAKMMGGLGICGRSLCCSTFLNDFGQVSIKMAKEQNLSLNSAKISGSCGRLMCCLRYEYGTYADEISKTPCVDTIVETPDGSGVVTEISPLAGLVKVLLHDDPGQPPRLYNRADLKPLHSCPKAKQNENVEENENLSDDINGNSNEYEDI